ncbi:restriction endonuclease subunit S [Pseudoalteromonas sp. B131b]|uniref:restriction endonuclease subunit S n=1 Tax=Pseudoalteromonas sp. B131b TaxID=630493 RepID=UPI00301E1BBE
MSELNTGKYQAYPEYKDSSSKWLDSIPSHWKVTFLKHVLSTPITDGPHSTPVFIDEGIPFVSAEAVSGGYIDFDKIRGFISKEDDAFFSQKYSPKRHDVYMIKSGATTGITAIVETDKHFNIWSPLAVMRCKNTYNPYFLLNSLRSDFFQKSVQLSWTFGTQQNIGMGTLENLTVCYPPLEEQIQIANFLDHETAKIDMLIEKQQQLIKLLKEKRQAVISHAVTKGLNPQAPMKDSGVEWLGEVPEHWVICRLKNALTIRNGRDYKQVEVESGGYPVYGSGGVFKRSSKYLFDGSSVLFGRKGTIDKPLVVSGKFWTVDTMFYSEINTFHEAKYIYYQASMFPFSLLSTSTALPSMTQEDLLNLGFVSPPLTEQQKIVEYLKIKLDRFEVLISKVEQSIILSKERRTALISAAVSGKIDVRHWEQPND